MSVPASTIARAVFNNTVTPTTDKVQLLDNKEIHHIAGMA